MSGTKYKKTRKQAHTSTPDVGETPKYFIMHNNNNVIYFFKKLM